MTTATPAKLKSGAWGARVRGTARTGDTIEVRTQSGKTWQATVTAVVWQGDGVTLVATESADGPTRGGRSTRRGTWTGCSCGSVEEYSRPGDCRTCRFDRDDC